MMVLPHSLPSIPSSASPSENEGYHSSFDTSQQLPNLHPFEQLQQQQSQHQDQHHLNHLAHFQQQHQQQQQYPSHQDQHIHSQYHHQYQQHQHHHQQQQQQLQQHHHHHHHQQQHQQQHQPNPQHMHPLMIDSSELQVMTLMSQGSVTSSASTSPSPLITSPSLMSPDVLMHSTSPLLTLMNTPTTPTTTTMSISGTSSSASSTPKMSNSGHSSSPKSVQVLKKSKESKLVAQKLAAAHREAAGLSKKQRTTPPCDRCRQRRIKCDRQEPCCSSCIKYKATCMRSSFPAGVPLSTVSIDSTRNSSPTTHSLAAGAHGGSIDGSSSAALAAAAAAAAGNGDVFVLSPGGSGYAKERQVSESEPFDSCMWDVQMMMQFDRIKRIEAFFEAVGIDESKLDEIGWVASQIKIEHQQLVQQTPGMRARGSLSSATESMARDSAAGAIPHSTTSSSLANTEDSDVKIEDSSSLAPGNATDEDLAFAKLMKNSPLPWTDQLYPLMAATNHLQQQHQQQQLQPHHHHQGSITGQNSEAGDSVFSPTLSYVGLGVGEYPCICECNCGRK